MNYICGSLYILKNKLRDLDIFGKKVPRIEPSMPWYRQYSYFYYLLKNELTFYFPVNIGFLFSIKAFTPSLKSSVFPASVCNSSSTLNCSESEFEKLWFTALFVNPNPRVGIVANFSAKAITTLSKTSSSTA